MCVLRVTSSNQSFSEQLRSSKLNHYLTFEKGEPLTPKSTKQRTDYGFSIDVSKRAWSDLDAQIQDAIKFLDTHHTELATIIESHESVEMTLDFPYEAKGHFVQTNFLPLELISLAASLKIGIALSLYSREEE
ncbi:hypothetical protein Rhal01_02403 [Rubritalea halochordaticola]|uniref:DUF4279 domain-containing protein n=1 Tax=Rubritalea halochordaticola TaxID=714537 RepID=A0ABP9V545_9BACT